MKLTRILVAGASAAAIATVFGGPAFAQQTSANLRGVVTNAQGAPIADARVTIVHTPSGTADDASTGAGGAFFESGLRGGGPYTITITAPGYEAEQVEGVYINPGDTKYLTFDLDALKARDEILVIGRSVAQIDLNNGAGSSFDRDSISNQPSVSRDVVDTLLRDPLVNSNGGTGVISVAGVNPRYNALAIDGVLQGDDFGLGSSIYATSRPPISLDAVQSAAIVASDYSVESSGFQGGLVNVVTKSGTNEFHGSGYYYRSDEDYVGELSNGTPVPASPFLEQEYGFSLGGPIIRDKLFFFLNYEKFSTSSPANFAGSDQSDQILDADKLFSALNADILSGTGFDAGGRPTSTALPESSKRWLGKIDWNINDNHRLEASYQRTRETGTNVDNLSFVSAWYDTPVDLDSYSGAIYSDWTDRFSTTLRVGYKDFSRGQNCRAGSDFSEIQMRFDAADLLADPAYAGTIDPTAGQTTFIAGCDRFRHGNQFSDDRLQVFASGNYQMADHVITFGGEFERYNLFNLFLSDSNGTFIYNDLDSLRNGTNVTVNYRNVVSNNKNDAAAQWGYDKLSLFASDEWQVTPVFSVNAGVRYERFFQSDRPQDRADFQAAYGRSNLDTLDGVDIFQPRVGFRYEPLARTTITGGFGLFSGGNPQVWVSNAFQPQIFEESGVFNGVTPGTVPQTLLDAIAASDPTTPTFIDTISPNFKIPSQWKGSLKLTQSFDMNFGGINLGTDYQFSIQYLYTKIKNDFVWRNLAQTELGLPEGVAPDGRPIYSDLQALGVDNAVELGNTKGGRSHVLSVALAKQYDSGFDFDVSYAFQDVTSVTPGTSSRGVSNWRSLVTFDRNNPEVGTAPFETRHAFNVNLGYENEFFGEQKTRVDLFGTIVAGDPFSYTFNVSSSNPLFGRAGNFESPFDNDLLYIPTMSGGASTDSAVVFGSGFQGSTFEDFVDARGLKQGGIVPKNSNRGSWNQLWNFRFQQELPFANLGMSRLDGNSLKLVIDVRNVLNLINDEWGARFDAPGFDTEGIVSADLLDVSQADTNGDGTLSQAETDAATIANGGVLSGNGPATVCQSKGDCVYRFNSFSSLPSSFPSLSSSVYKIRIGIRYDF